jgi:enolase
MTEIVAIRAREILDSRGNPTVEADVILESGALGRAAVPSGASTGEHEAVELRDGDKSPLPRQGRFAGRRKYRNHHRPELEGFDARTSACSTHTMIQLDGTANKSKLGANAILAVSMAASRAVAQTLEIPLYRYLGGANACILPTPMMNVLNGGAHADSSVDFQEFMVMPVGAERFSDALRWGAEVFHTLKGVLKKKGYSTAVGDEGGFAPSLTPTPKPSKSSSKPSPWPATSPASRSPSRSIPHPASSTTRTRRSTSSRRATSASSPAKRWSTSTTTGSANTPSSLEDGLAEDDWEGWRCSPTKLAARSSWSATISFVTNVKRLQRGIEEGVGNSILIKLNQIGTVTETFEAIELGRRYGYTSIISHRSGETEDTFIADFAVATGAGQIKTGSASAAPTASPSTTSLLRIEEELGQGANFLGIESLNYNE